jgi:hypothetical protein
METQGWNPEDVAARDGERHAERVVQTAQMTWSAKRIMDQ